MSRYKLILTITLIILVAGLIVAGVWFYTSEDARAILRVLMSTDGKHFDIYPAPKP